MTNESFGEHAARPHGCGIRLAPLRLTKRGTVNLTQLQANFRQRYGRTPRLFRAPGRVNLIGEHTDYNEGFVLPLALERATVAAGAARPDRRIRAASLQLEQEIEFDLAQPPQRLRGTWADYVEGMARSLIESGVPVRGADLLVDSDVPVGSGLSSSAALEMAVGLALIKLADAKLDRLQLARAGQRAEHEYVGARVGIMDQLTSVLGRPATALLIDCRSLAVSYLPLALVDTAIFVCDSRVKHELAASAYNQRRAECEQGLALLRQALPDLQSLRDVSVADFQAHEASLPARIARRCRHVVTENARTLAAAEALRLNRWETLGQLMNASHASLRDDYEVSCAELDLLVETAQQLKGVLGARLTGGGFGGCTVNLVRTESAAAFSTVLRHTYERAFGRVPGIYHIQAGAGAAELVMATD
jgi:galactokinase